MCLPFLSPKLDLTPYLNQFDKNRLNAILPPVPSAWIGTVAKDHQKILTLPNHGERPFTIAKPRPHYSGTKRHTYTTKSNPLPQLTARQMRVPPSRTPGGNLNVGLKRL